MIRNERTVATALDAFQADRPPVNVPSAMARLVESLARRRTEVSAAEWRGDCVAAAAHPALARLAEDPYSRDARRKPAGYAGDARTLDYVYLRAANSAVLTADGRAIFDVATSVPIARAVRSRAVALGRRVAARAASGRVRVASIACGHARELDRVTVPLLEQIQYWGLDQDAQSIAFCQRRLPASVGVFVPGSVRDVLTGRVRIPSSDLVYAGGLFDYLDKRAGALLLKRMFAATRAGGTVLVPNLSPANHEIAYMEAIMDWWMVYRTEADLRDLASAAALPETAAVRTFATANGRVTWLEVARTA